MAPKRAAASAACAVAKRTKVDPVAQKVDAVAAEIRRLELLPPQACDVLCDGLPFSLGVVKEQRHRFQEEVLEIASKLFSEAEASRQKMVEDRQAACDLAEREKDADLSAEAEAEAGLEAKKQACKERKSELAEVALAFQAAKAELREREEEERRGIAELDGTGQSKADLEAILEQVGVAQAPDAVPLLVGRIARHIPCEESLQTALPATLPKEPVARGAFDVMVLQQVRDGLSKRGAELEAMIASGATTKAELRKRVELAKATFEKAMAAQMAAATAYTKAADEQGAAATAVAIAKAAVKKARQQIRESEQELARAQIELESLSSGLLATFDELRSREAVTPPPPEPMRTGQEAGELAVADAPTLVEAVA